MFTATSGENFTFFSFHIIYGELTIPQVFLLLFFSKEFTYDLLHLQKVNSPVWPKLSEHQKKRTKIILVLQMIIMIQVKDIKSLVFFV